MCAHENEQEWSQSTSIEAGLTSTNRAGMNEGEHDLFTSKQVRMDPPTSATHQTPQYRHPAAPPQYPDSPTVYPPARLRLWRARVISNMPAHLFLLFYFSQLIQAFLHLSVLKFLSAFSSLLFDRCTLQEYKSKCYFKCVIINILIDIEGAVDVQGLRKIDLPVHWRIRWKLGEQVRSMDN